MKSLNKNTKTGYPFKNKFFSENIVKYLLEEGFGWRDTNDSYGDSRNPEVDGCYKKYEDGNGFDIFIYICEDGIEIDQDYDCGGNLNTHFIKFDDSNENFEAFEDAYDDMVDYVNKLKG